MRTNLLLDGIANGFREEVKEIDANFLDLSGRKAFYSQGIFGQGIIVAVLDTGVSSKHPELSGRILEGKNFCKYRLSNNTEDDNGHGTHVAATIAGKDVGIAPKAEILPIKILDQDGSGSWGEEVLPGLEWVKDYRSADGRKVNIVSMSLGGKEIGDKDKRAMRDAIRKLVENDIAVIVAAGNSGKEEFYYPGAYDDVICVGAVDTNREIAMFSTTGKQVDLCQVGVDVLSAWYEGGYKKLSGTSMATPIVSGIAALMASKYKMIFGKDIKEDYLWKNLKMNTKDIGVTGVDKIYGAGFCTLQPVEASIIVTKGSRTATINGDEVPTGRTIRFRNGSLSLPVNIVSEATGCYTEADNKNGQVKLVY